MKVSNSTSLNHQQCKDMIKFQWKRLCNSGRKNAGKIFFIQGPSGIGKTELMKQVTKEFGEEEGIATNIVINNCAAMDATDLSGLPYLSDKRQGLNKEMKFAQPQSLPQEGRTLLFFDEFNRIKDLDMKAALLSLMVDYSINQNQLGNEVLIVTAGNNWDDDYETEEFDLALKDRVAVVGLKPSMKGYMKYMKDKYKNNILVNYCNKNFNIICFNGGKDGMTPRTFENLVAMTSDLDVDNDADFKMFSMIASSYMGCGELKEFIAYLSEIKRVTVNDIVDGSIFQKDLARHDSILISKLNEDLVNLVINSILKLKVDSLKNISRYLNESIARESLTTFYTDSILKMAKMADSELSEKVQKRFKKYLVQKDNVKELKDVIEAKVGRTSL